MTLKEFIKQIEIANAQTSVFRTNSEPVLEYRTEPDTGRIAKERMNPLAIKQEYEQWLEETITIKKEIKDEYGYRKGYIIEFTDKVDEYPPCYDKINSNFPPYWDEDTETIILPSINKSLDIFETVYDSYASLSSDKETYKKMMTHHDALILYLHKDLINRIITEHKGDRLVGTCITKTEHNSNMNIAINFDNGIILPEYITLVKSTRTLNKL